MQTQTFDSAQICPILTLKQRHPTSRKQGTVTKGFDLARSRHKGKNLGFLQRLLLQDFVSWDSRVLGSHVQHLALERREEVTLALHHVLQTTPPANKPSNIRDGGGSGIRRGDYLEGRRPGI